MKFRNNSTCLRLAALVCLSFAVTTCFAGTFQVEDRSEIRLTKAKIRASQFLSRATFGPTPEAIDVLAARMVEIGEKQAAGEWIDNQITQSPSFQVPATRAVLAEEGLANDENGQAVNVRQFRNYAWWNTVIGGNDQLRQRVAFALSQILVIGPTGTGFNNKPGNPNAFNGGLTDWLGMCDYYDMMIGGAFGNYRELLEEVTYSPLMGTYLSHRRNAKANPELGLFPDENYAREVMQLFSIGLNELRDNGQLRKVDGQIVPTYDNETIKTFARVFTGLNYAQLNRFTTDYPRNFGEPMVAYEDEHDTDEKTLLRGTTLPANQTTAQDIDGALDNLFEHPNCPPFICRLLIQRLVKSNPSKGYIKRVVRVFKDNGSGERGDIEAVVRAILLDNEAWRSTKFVVNRSDLTVRVVPKGTEHSRLREPVTRYSAFIRAFSPVSTHSSGNYRVTVRFSDWSQEIHYAPSVFNFYLPNHQPSGPLTTLEASKRIPNRSLYAPEFQLLTAVTANRTANRLSIDVRGKRAVSSDLISLNFDELEGMADQDDIQGILDRLDLLLCQGSLSDQSRQIIADALSLSTNPVYVAEAAIIGTLMSPDFNIAK